jgi:hypothetical protein
MPSWPAASGWCTRSPSPTSSTTALEDQLGMLLKGGPNALRESKELVFTVQGGGMSADNALKRRTAQIIAQLRVSAEGQEGLAAFLEKRAPLSGRARGARRGAEGRRRRGQGMTDGLRIRRLLVANRGEIACRIMRSCRRLGIETMAVHSSADAWARHVREADTAVAIGGAAPAESYLDGRRIIEAALAAGVDAIHPGYGFLSENAEFRPRLYRGGPRVRRAARADHPPHGLEERGQGHHAGCRRAGRAGLPRRRAVAGDAGEACRGDRLPAADQGLRRRRRQGHAGGARGGRVQTRRWPRRSASP